ncbi:MAG: AAA family ATPase, partial [Blautia sp.]|nr:AAA family ATPase [Blautia sp.]
MKKMLTVKEVAKLWNIPDSLVTRYCRAGRVPGAEKFGRAWMIPAGTAKPEDRRVFREEITYGEERQLPLPIGVSNYCEASTDYYYIDKTLLIKEILDEMPKVSLFTRPRRFGKTLNMDMLRVFFEKSDEDTSVYFLDKKIWTSGPMYREYQGKYPVIFLTFKDVKKESWQDAQILLMQLIRMEYQRHKVLENIPLVSDKEYYQRMVTGDLDPALLESSVQILSKMLHEHYGVPAIIIIDEYDTPIQQGYTRGYYEHAVLFMRNFFSGAFKDNKHLAFGFLTGILRVAKESIFSGLNNLTVNSVLDSHYSTHFGFTLEEVKRIAEYYGASDKMEEICDWYDGYRFGETEIFNPWSVINYFARDCEPRAYWVSTGSTDIIQELLAEADEEIQENLTSLVEGKTVLTQIDTSVIYPQIRNNPFSIYSFLVVTGYLKVENSIHSIFGDTMYEVALPNKEITWVYRKEILQHFSAMIPQSTVVHIQYAMHTGDTEKLKAMIQKLLTQSVSYFDTASEGF